MYAAMRAASGSVAIEQGQWGYIDTVETDESSAKKKNLPIEIKKLPRGGRALRIRSSTAPYALVDFHAGGFNATCPTEYLDFLLALIHSTKGSSGNAKLNIPPFAYDTAPSTTYLI
jgi:hypothetical protein